MTNLDHKKASDIDYKKASEYLSILSKYMSETKNDGPFEQFKQFSLLENIRATTSNTSCSINRQERD